MRRISRCVAGGVFFAAAAAAFAEAPAVAPPPAEPPKKSGLEFNVGDATIKFYGFIRLDMHFDDSHPNDTQLISWIKSENGTTSAYSEKKNAEDLTIHARNTRFGVDVSSPPIAMLGDATVMGKIEMDFLANGGSEAVSISRGVVRMRQAYVKMSWDDVSVLAGQTWDIISPLIPAANMEFCLWGAGNTGDRRPMVMADYRPKLADGHQIILQGEAGLTGADDNQNADNASASTIRDGEASGLPTFQTRIAYKGSHPWLPKKTFEVGVWGHYAQEHLDAVAAGARDDYPSGAGGLDATLPICDYFELRGELWKGRNLDDIRGAIFQGINTTQGISVRARGYWAEAVVKPLDWYKCHVGITRDNPVNDDVPDVTPVTGAGGKAENRVFYVANRFDFGGGVSVGLDWLHWTTTWINDLPAGRDNRYTFFIMYAF
jgi:hypothetical protein